MYSKCFISLKHKQHCPFSRKKNVVWFTTAWAGQQAWWDHSNNQGIDGVGPTARCLWGAAAKLHARFLCSQVLSPEKISNWCALLRCQKHNLVTVFKGSQCCECDKQPEAQCELYLLSYFIVWENKKGNWGTAQIVTIKKVDLNPLFCISCKRTLITCILSA